MLNFLKINTDNLLKSVDLLWKGMLAIFIAIAIIFIFILILNYFSKIKANKTKNKE